MNRHSDPIEEFFERVAVSPQPLLHDVAATIRIDLEDDGEPRHWLLRIDHGKVEASRRKAAADVVIGTDPALFERIIVGEANVMTAALRGRVRLQGNMHLLIAFNRLMPGPPHRKTKLPTGDGAAMLAARSAKANGTTARTDKASAAAARASRRDRER